MNNQTLDKTDVINELAGALCKAQAEMKAAEMNSTNPFLHNRYADLGSVIEAARPVLAKNGLSFSQLVSGADGAVTVTTMLLHSSGQWLSSAISLPIFDEKGKSMAQVAGSIITYLRRYSLSSILGIYADEDVDGNEPQLPAQTQKPQQQAQRPAAPTQRPQAPKQAPANNKPVTPAKVTHRDGKTFTEPDTAYDPNNIWGAVDLAGRVTTKKGTPLGSLTADQLKIIVEKETDGGIKSSAETLLGKPDDRHFTEFYALVGKADQSGMIPIVADPKDDICLGELRQLMVEIQNSLDAISAPDK